MQLELLCQLRLDADVQEKLGKIPPQLEQLYFEIYEKRVITHLGETGRSVLINALKWLSCAQEQLKSSEFCTTVAMNVTVSPEDISKDRILDLCHPFVVFDDGLDTFRFAHLSVREFLEKRFEYSQGSCHILAAEVCLIQLAGSSKCPAVDPFFNKKIHLQACEKLASTEETISGGLQKYATVFWMIHCQLSGQKEREGNPRFEKIFRFFFFDNSGTDSPLSTWMLHYRRRTLKRGEPTETRGRLEETRGLHRCYYVASRYGFCEILHTCLTKKRLSKRIKRECLILAAFSGQVEAFKLLSSTDGDFGSVDQLIPIVAEHLIQETLVWFLDQTRKVKLTEELCVAAAAKGGGTLAMVLGKYKDSEITEAMLKFVVGNGDIKAFKLLSAWADENTISVNLLQDAASGNNLELMKILLDRFGVCCITTNVMRAATMALDDSGDIMQMLLDLGNVSHINSELVLDAAEACNDELLQVLLSREYETTLELLMVTARKCRASTLEIMLGNHGAISLEFLIQMMQQATMNRSYAPSVMKQLLNRTGRIRIPQDVLIAVGHSDKANELMSMFLEEGMELELTEEALKAAIALLHFDETLLYLLEQVKVIRVTQGFLLAAASNLRFADKILNVLMEIDHSIEIPEQLVILAATNDDTGMEVMQLIEERFGTVEITHEIFRRSALSAGPKTMRFLLNRVDPAMITEEVLIWVIMSPSFQQPNDILKLLIERAIDLPITDKSLRYAAQFSAMADDTLELIWSRNRKVAITDELAEAAAKSNYALEVFVFFLDRIKDIEIGEVGITAIITNNSYPEEIFELLCGRGLRVKATETVLKAAAYEESGMLRMLLQQDDCANVTEDVFAAAATSGSKKSLRALSAYCKMAQPPQKWLNLARLLRVVTNHEAVDDNMDLVKELLSQGVELDFPDSLGSTVLSHAIRHSSLSVVQALLSAGANPNLQDKKGETPLDKAVSRCSYQLVKELLSYGANPNLKNHWGYTPLFTAASRGHYGITELLLNKGALSNVTSWLGETPSEFAMLFGKLHISRLLDRHSDGYHET